jgi:CRP-like cAMP-binding protein
MNQYWLALEKRNRQLRELKLTGNVDNKLSSICLDDRKIQRADCQHCSIRHRMLFAPLDIETLSPVLRPINHMLSAAKTRLYHQGQPPQNIFSLRRGFVKLTQLSEDGQEHIVRLLGPGSCIGLEALMRQDYNQTAEALTEIDYCAIPVKTIYQLEHEQPVLYKSLIEQWQQQLSEADDWLASFFTGTIKQRFCRFLLMQLQLQKLPAEQLFLISNQDIASVLATTDESISRCVSSLRKSGVLKRVDKRIYKLDVAATKVLAAG